MAQRLSPPDPWRCSSTSDGSLGCLARSWRRFAAGMDRWWRIAQEEKRENLVQHFGYTISSVTMTKISRCGRFYCAKLPKCGYFSRDVDSASGRAGQATDPGGVGDKYLIGSIDEEATFDHADDASDALFQSCRFDDRPEAAVENTVAAVGDKGFAIRSRAQQCHGTQGLEGHAGWLQSEYRHLDGNWH